MLFIFFVVYDLLSYVLAFFGAGEYVRTAVGQVISVIPIAAMFVRIKKVGVKPFFRFRKIRFADGMLWFFFGICACCAFTLINIPAVTFWSNFVDAQPSVTPPADIYEYFFGVVCIALVPAICEELLCRGIVMREYEMYSGKTAIIVSAAAFALLHNSAPMLVYTFLIGLVLAFVVRCTESIYPAMIIHFAINFFSLTINYLSQSVIPMHMQPEFALVMNMIFVFLSLVFLIMLFTLIKNRIDVLTDSDMTRPSHKYGISISMILVIALFLINQVRMFL